MAQNRIWDYGAPRKSKYLNDKFIEVIPTRRVYTGYKVQAQGPATLNLDINLAGANTSVLITQEGVRVEEDADLIAAVTIAPDAALDRIDWVVASHQYTNDNNPQTYEVIQGTTSPPAPPASLPDYKVLLATVYVPGAATTITDDLITNEQEVNISVINNSSRADFIELRPEPQKAPDDTVFVNGGTYVTSNGSAVATVADGVADTVTFAPVVTPGNERYDLLTLDDTGTAGSVVGTEAGAGLAVVPNYPTDRQVVAEIFIDEDTGVRINESDIKDVRFFFNLGGGGGGGGGVGTPTIYEVHYATASQTVFTLSSAYSEGTYSLEVFRNGNRQTVTVDYTETDEYTVTFSSPLLLNDEVVFIQWGGGATSVITARQDFTATAGQTVFDLSFGYLPGNQEILVFSSGVLMKLTDDYLETDADTITFVVGRSPGERVTVMRIGAQSSATPKLWEKYTATGGQTVFSLSGTYTLGGHGLQVYRNGKLLTVTDEYAETDEQTVTLVTPALAGDVFIFFIPGGDTLGYVAAGILNSYQLTTTGGETVISLPWEYEPGTNNLLVFRNGAQQEVTLDFTETTTSSFTISPAAGVGESIVAKRIAMGAVGGQHSLDFHTGVTTAGQSAFLAAQNAGADGTKRFVHMGDIGASATGGGSPVNFRGYHSGLQIRTSDTNPNYQIEIMKGAVVQTDDLSDSIVTSADLTLDITASGANGLDAGLEAADTWYFIWLIKKSSDGTVASLLSTSDTAPTMPSGYDLKRLVGAVRNNSSSHFLRFFQDDANVKLDDCYTVVSFTTSPPTSYTAVDISAVVPAGYTASVRIHGQISGDETHMIVRRSSAQTGSFSFAYVSTTATRQTSSDEIEVALADNGSFEYYILSGWTDMAQGFIRVFGYYMRI